MRFWAVVFARWIASCWRWNRTDWWLSVSFLGAVGGDLNKGPPGLSAAVLGAVVGDVHKGSIGDDDTATMK